jgi:microcystin degradation protein MlrC
LRLVLAMMKHETNTFSPIAATWDRFESWSAHFGEDARRAYRGTAMPLGAYLALAEAAGADAAVALAAEAMPSGPVTADAYDRMTDAICEEVARGCDAALLDLHGAMVADTTDDGEGTLLARLREIAPRLPIAVTCDLHCNLTAAMVENCTALIGYKTYPHTDMHEVARQVGDIVMRSVRGEVAPVMAWGNRPLLAQTLRQGTDDEPMRGLVAMARQAEADGALAATIFGGFPLADVADAGISAITVTDGDRQAANAVTSRLLDAAWNRRADFVYRGAPLADAIDRGRRAAETLRSDGIRQPVILLDHADNCGSGGTQDDMTVIAAVRDAGLDDVAVAAVWDPEAARILHAAGRGAVVTLTLGGRTEMPSIGAHGEPLAVTGTVSALTDGRWTVAGPMYTGVAVDMGPTAVLAVDGIEIMVVSKHHEPWDVGVFTSVGIDPASKTFLLLKSRIHYRAGFAALAGATIPCDGRGVTTSDNAVLEFEHVRRPIYPLDDGPFAPSPPRPA